MFTIRWRPMLKAKYNNNIFLAHAVKNVYEDSPYSTSGKVMIINETVLKLTLNCVPAQDSHESRDARLVEETDGMGGDGEVKSNLRTVYFAVCLPTRGNPSKVELVFKIYIMLLAFPSLST